jgi:ceramide glucosyltransferase
VALLSQLCAGVGLALLLASALYALVSFAAVLTWYLNSLHRARGGPHPPVTVLKPLCGLEPDLYANLRTFCQQDYPHYQVVFGVRESGDPAVAIAQRLIREFPELPLQLVIDERLHGGNLKISNLINMLPCARHDLLIIADSDTRVARDYLDAVTRPLLDARTGMVTCIHRSVPVDGLWSRLGSMFLNDWYIPSVLLAWLFGHRGYASGQTMAMRRDTLLEVGGFESIADQLADDYRLAERVRAAGLRIALSTYTLETVQSEPSATDLLRHELRWMRTIRALAPMGFRFLFVSFTLPMLVLAWLLIGRPAQSRSLILLVVAMAALCRLGISLVPRLAQREIPMSDFLLVPARDLLLCWTWLRALRVSRISWRGSEYQVDRTGVLHSDCRPMPD